MSQHSARGSEWTKQAKRIKKRDGYVCTSCGSEHDLTVDHVNPVALNPGKVYEDHELVTLCRRCNGRKQDKIMTRLDWVNPRWFSHAV